jgi:hypothetical protein
MSDNTLTQAPRTWAAIPAAALGCSALDHVDTAQRGGRAFDSDAAETQLPFNTKKPRQRDEVERRHLGNDGKNKALKHL